LQRIKLGFATWKRVYLISKAEQIEILSSDPFCCPQWSRQIQTNVKSEHFFKKFESVRMDHVIFLGLHCHKWTPCHLKKLTDANHFLLSCMSVFHDEQFSVANKQNMFFFLNVDKFSSPKQKRLFAN